MGATMVSTPGSLAQDRARPRVDDGYSMGGPQMQPQYNMQQHNQGFGGGYLAVGTQPGFGPGYMGQGYVSQGYNAGYMSQAPQMTQGPLQMPPVPAFMGETGQHRHTEGGTDNGQVCARVRHGWERRARHGRPARSRDCLECSSRTSGTRTDDAWRAARPNL